MTAEIPFHDHPMRPSFSTHAAFLGAALALTACREPTADELARIAPRVAAVQGVVVRGTSVGLRLVNDGPLAWVYGTCPGLFERFEGGEWVELPFPIDWVCPQSIDEIHGGETILTSMHVPSSLDAGTYRAVVGFRRDGQWISRASSSFTVTTASAGDAPTVSVLDDEVGRGQQVMLALRNAGTIRFFFNLCSGGRLEVRIGDVWTPEEEPLRLCTADMQLLGAGSEVGDTYYIPPNARTGSHRLRVSFYSDAGAVERYSNVFVVR